MILTALLWQIRDVFRQARATGLLATLVSASGVAGAICLTVLFVEDSETGRGTLSLFFGRFTIIRDADIGVAVGNLQFLCAGLLADTVGVLLTLVWTAGFLPSFLEPSAVSVLLIKPVSRSSQFLGRIVGVLVFVAAMSAMFVGATGCALGFRTGVWNAGFWTSVPILLLHFAVFYGFSALMAVVTRNTAACVVGAILFWVLCWAMNYGRHTLICVDSIDATATLGRSTEFGYWLLPKPADFGLILHDALGNDRLTSPLFEFQRVKERGLFQPVASVLSSLAFGIVMVILAAYEFANQDY